MKTFALFAFVAFAGLNLYAAVSAGITGLPETFSGGNAWTAVAVADLLIALLMLSVWIVRDAKKSGRSAWPYIALTLGTGSLGPLLYVLTKKEG